MKSNKPVSAEMFDDLYLKMATKISKSEDTIFEGIDISKDCDKNYMKFIQNKNYYDDFVQESSVYEKNKIIKMFIESEVLSSIYTDVYDHMILESDTMELSFKQSVLTENTEEVLNVKYLGADLTYLSEVEQLLEEGETWDHILTKVKKGALYISNKLADFILKRNIKARFGSSLLIPVRKARENDIEIEKIFGTAGLAVYNYGSSLGQNGNSKFGQSRENALIFDNIDLNPEVKKLFHELTTSNGSVSKGVASLEAIITQCVFDSELLDNEDVVDKGQLGYFEGKYDPRKDNVIKAIKDDLVKNANSDDKLSGQVIQFRKCLITKLLDIYKFLMIVSISESQEYKQIVKIMHRGFTDDYVNLLGFMPEGNEQEVETKAKILQLVQLRIVYNKLSDDLSKGAFDIDKDAGKFFKERLKQVDSEIEQELRNRSRKIDVLHETQADNNEKDIKGAALTEREMKRSHFLSK